MQLFELEHMGRRRLAALRDKLHSRYPQIDSRQIAMDCGIKSDWSQATSENRSLQAALRALTQLRDGPVPDIALQLGDQAQITDSGLLGYAVLTAPTVLQAARITSHALNQSNYLLRNKIVMSGEHARTVFTVAGTARSQSEQILEMSMIAVWRCIQAIIPSGRAVTPSYVTFNFPAPPYKDRFTELFACPVEFNSSHSVLAMPKSLVHVTIPSGNAELIRTFSSELKQLLGDGYRGNSITARVRRALIENPQSCAYSLEGTAKQLNIAPRSLRRYLSQNGHSFRQVCLEVRMQLAQQYLHSSNMPLKAIAYQLGYKHASNFNRAFCDYFGAPPETLRRRRQETNANSANLPK